jgi:hypothetical protein
MICVIRNQCVFQTVMHTSMKQLVNSTETNKVYLEMFDMRSTSYSAKRQRDIRLLPCTPQL